MCRYLAGEVIVIRFQHIAGCQSLYSHILSTRADTPADSALRHGSGDTTDHVPELGAQTAAPPGNDEFTALAEQLAIVKAESDAAQAHSYAQITNLAAENKQMLSMFELIIFSRLPERPGDAPAATPPPPVTPAATPMPHQQDIAHTKQRFDEQATFDAAVDAAVARSNANAAHAARSAATSTPPSPRAASYSSAAAPQAPAGYRVPAAAPPPPPPPPAFSYANGPISSTDRPAPVKSFTLLMVKCLKINLIPAGMETVQDRCTYYRICLQ